MENFQPIYSSVFLFILLTSQSISIEGRQMKSNKRTDSKFTANIPGHNKARPQTHAQQTTSGPFHGTAEKHKSPQMAPIHSSAFGVPAAVHIDDFRPTAPGNSPGVGHRLEAGKADTKAFVESPDLKWIDDFRHTTPSDSPGVGHPFVSGTNNIAPNHPREDHGVGHPLARYRDDSRPTMPGRSPGVGHFHGEETTKPKCK
ncbi:hypothetical protein Ancab_003768 [Ancistrocladus abbreviatus]